MYSIRNSAVSGRPDVTAAPVLAAGIGCVLLLVGAVAPAAAQSGGNAGAEVRGYDIPAGPLARALNEFASQTGALISASGSLTEGRVSPGVAGEFTPREALDRLLAGSGVAARFSDADTVTLFAAAGTAQETPMQLAPIEVEGWRSTTTRGYRPEMITSATKTNALIADTPVSVSVVTAEVIADQYALTVGEALRNVAGVEAGPNFANVSVQEEFTIRGFPNTFVNVNGVERRSTGPLSTANIESIEVIKGPSSVLTGAVSPGGMINIQTKRPQREAAYSLIGGFSQTTTGGGTQGRAVIDATGPVNESGTMLYRFIASADGGDSFIDFVDNEQYLINPMVSFLGLDGDLRVDVDFSYLRNDETFLFGIPFRNGRPDDRIGRTTFLAARDNRKLTEDYGAEIRTEYRITDVTRIDAAFTYHLNEHLTNAQRSFPDDEVQPDDTFGSSLDNLDQESYDIEFEANLIHDLSVGQTDWRLLFGGDVRRSVFQDNALFFALEEPDINVLDPANDARLPRADDPDLFVLPNRDNTTDSFGFYAQAEVWIHDRLMLLGGLRYDDIEFTARRAGNRSEQNDDEFSPRAGVLFELTPDLSMFGSYSRSFQQESGSDAQGNPFDPTEGKQWEFGLKQEWFGGGVLATLTGFRVTQTNLPVTDPDNPIGQVQIGEVESEGIELEFRGQVTDDLRVSASYAYLDNEIANNPLGNEGNRLRNVPENQAGVFALWDLISNGDRRLSLGGGVFYTGDRFAEEGNAVELVDFVTADLTAQYAFRLDSGLDLQLQAGVKNLFDEKYFAQGASRVAFRGDPRTVFATLTARY